MGDQAQRLADEFPAAMLRTNNEKRGLTYVPISEVVARLNSVLGVGAWDYEVVETGTFGTKETLSGTYPLWITAHVRLTATVDDQRATKDGYGGQQVKFLSVKQGEQLPTGPVDIGDEFKGAVSDALKKAAQHFGVGLHLARQEEAKAEERRQEQDPVPDGWGSWREHEEFVDAIRARARALNSVFADRVKKWVTDNKFAWPASRADAEAFAAVVAEQETAQAGDPTFVPDPEKGHDAPPVPSNGHEVLAADELSVLLGSLSEAARKDLRPWAVSQGMAITNEGLPNVAEASDEQRAALTSRLAEVAA